MAESVYGRKLRDDVFNHKPRAENTQEVGHDYKLVKLVPRDVTSPARLRLQIGPPSGSQVFKHLRVWGHFPLKPPHLVTEDQSSKGKKPLVCLRRAEVRRGVDCMLETWARQLPWIPRTTRSYSIQLVL